MKRFSFLLFFLLVLSCSREKITPEPEPEEEKPEEFVPSPLKEGRVALSYVTYYSQGIPDPTLLTHICYAFAELYVVNGQYREFRLQGDESRFAAVVDLKKNHPGLKILLAFTHTVVNKDNAQGGGFSDMSSTEEGRVAFAQDCLEFIQTWGIDGIDIGWEFPGISWSGHKKNEAADTQNHVLLMKQLRQTLGPDLLITFPGYVMNAKQVTGGTQYIDLKGVEPYVDFVNVMTYDMDEAPHHHSALEDSRAYWDCARTLQAYRAAGFPTDKMVLGIPFYGRISFSKSPSAITYRQIKNLDPSLYSIDNWDPTASVPYVSRISTGAFYCGYDNAASIAQKGSWALSQGMKGLMCWMYNGDDDNGTLRKAMWNAVMKP